MSRAEGNLIPEANGGLYPATAPYPALTRAVEYAYQRCAFYREKLDAAGVKPTAVRRIVDLGRLPFTTKDELRQAYPLKVMAAPEEEIVRIHSSSGTTGQPVIIPYTRRDVQVWAEMMARCLQMAGVTPRDRVQITPGYGLWTAGVGFQAGVERLGAMAIPTGPGNTERQLALLRDLQTTVLIGTFSYGLLLAEEVQRRGGAKGLALRVGIFGAERAGEKMRARIADGLGIDVFDIYGLTEVYGPGIGIDCPWHRGIHYWADYLVFEIIDPVTLEPLPPGEEGELVITTLVKEGLPLLRYRTRDLTRIIPEPCPCGCGYPMIDRVFGRSDDMIIIRGVNIYPAQIEQVIKQQEGLESEYRLYLRRQDGREELRVEVELDAAASATLDGGLMLLPHGAVCRARAGETPAQTQAMVTEGVPAWRSGDPVRVSADDDLPGEVVTLARALQSALKNRIGILAEICLFPWGSLPRSEKKTRRVWDEREG